MVSLPPQPSSDPTVSLSPPDILTQNPQEFAELVTFLDFADRLTIGFVEINFAGDGDRLIAALRQDPRCTEMRFEVMNFSQSPDLRFLRDQLLERVAQFPPLPDTPDHPAPKRVIIIRGLEVAIGQDGIGDYPPVLQDLNFVRDAYSKTLPYPLLFFLPDYAITRVAKYAPDFWAWRSGVFRFSTSAQTREAIRTIALEHSDSEIASPENQDQIDRLQRLLMEYHPSGQPLRPANQGICAEITYKLGCAYLTQHRADKARDYLQMALHLATQQQDITLQQRIYLALGKAYLESRQWTQAIAAFTQAKILAESAHHPRQVATTLFYLGRVAQAQRQWQQAQTYYQQALELYIEFGDRYSQASTYHNLGSVAQAQRQWQQAQTYYQQALELFIEFGDRYSQASTYHQLGMVAQAQRQFEQAQTDYQQALELFIEFGDRYSQASTYHQLGIVAQDQRQWSQAQTYYQQALELKIEFGDHYSQARTYGQLGIVAQDQRQWSQAQTYYQQALELFIEFGDRYSQAGTYHNLGLLAAAQEQFGEAVANLLTALEIFVEFNDEYRTEFTVDNLARLYQTTQDEAIPAAVAQRLGRAEVEVREGMRGNGE